METSFYGRYRYRILGVVGILVVLTLITLSGLVYGQAFTPIVKAQVDSDRSGLLLDPNADVVVRGINVGKVREVEPDNGRAKITIALEPDQADRLPSNVLAAIAAPTVFGAKFVDLKMPDRPAGPLQDGQVIRADDVSTEGNQVLDDLYSLLTKIDPAQLNATLGAISTALQGRGDNIGRYLVELNDFLIRFNPQLPLLQRDLRAGANVANIYADAAPDILRILDNATVLSRTLQDKQAGLDALFLSFTRLGNDVTGLLRESGPALDAATAELRPTTGLLAEYSPTFPCLFASVNQLRSNLEPIIGAGRLPGIGLYVNLLPSQAGYQNPEDKPLVGARNPPSCYGGPLLSAQNAVGPTKIPFIKLNDGVSTVDFTRAPGSISTPQELAVQLFGPDIIPLLDLGSIGPTPQTTPDAGSTARPQAPQSQTTPGPAPPNSGGG